MYHTRGPFTILQHVLPWGATVITSLAKKAALALWGRYISVFFMKMGFPRVLALAIGLSVRALISSEDTPFLGSRNVLPSSSSSLPSISGDSWIDESYGNRGQEASSSTPNPPVQQQQGAGPSNQPLPSEVYPFSDTEMIGGDTISAIQRRLLATYPPFPSPDIIMITHLEAQDLFEVKVKIIQKMAQWDPTGDWMGRGARALDNPRTASGEESLKRLAKMAKELEDTGPLSDVFWELKERAFLRR